MPATITRLAIVLTVVTLLTGCNVGNSADIRVAVASNFAGPASRLVMQYEKQTGRTAAISLGSTGALYAQIRNGAPFDVYLAADSEHPSRLEADGLAIPGTRFTYAVGRLVLWSRKPGFVSIPRAVLTDSSFRFLAIANPELAPYGMAAREVLRGMNLWQTLVGRMVVGENIGQTFQFVQTGNAELGFVAHSQLFVAGVTPRGSFWVVPDSLHAPIAQQAVLLQPSAHAIDFLDYLGGVEAQALIQEFGYDLP